MAAYPNATLDNFRLDHLDIQAATAGTIADSKGWTMSDINIRTSDKSELKILKAGEVPAKEGMAFGER